MHKSSKWERYLFYLTILVTALPVLLFRFFPTMDGAAHLYNSNLIFELLSGNDVLRNYFLLNTEPVPNWLGHFLLSLFNSFLPAFLAEKILLITYVVLLPLSFRRLVSTYKQPLLSYLIFPFVYTFLFYLGFYNLSIAFILFFYSIAFWQSTTNKFTLKNVIALFLLISLTYFAHILVFAFLGLTLFFIVLQDLIADRKRSKAVQYYFKQYAVIALASLPSLLLFANFLLKRDFGGSGDALPLSELLKWLKDVRPVIALSYAQEAKLTQWLFYLMIILMTGVIYKKWKLFSESRVANDKASNSLFQLISKNDIFLLLSVIILILYFKTPNNSGAGMMSDRYSLFFFIFFITWLATSSTPKWLQYVTIGIVLMVNTGLVWRYIGSTKNLSREATYIYKAATLIEENSTVLPVNHSNNWLQPHFSNYLGADRSLIILENYEASTGWFPILWNEWAFPKMTFGDTSQPESCLWWKTNDNNAPEQIDYIMIWGGNSEENECTSEITTIINQHYAPILTGNEFIKLYKLR